MRSAEPVGLDASIIVDRGAFHLHASLTVAAGTMTALIGPNGSGKSTIALTLAGLVPLTAGTIALGGRVLDDTAGGVTVPAGARGVAASFQEGLLFDGISVLDNVAFGVRAAGVPKAEARRRARLLLDEVGLADRAADRPRTLSGGLMARVGLARALAVDPALLILDEPFAALDPPARVELRDWLERVVRGRGVTTVLITHDPRDAVALADDAVVLEAGRVVERRPVAELGSSTSAFVAAFLR